MQRFSMLLVALFTSAACQPAEEPSNPGDEAAIRAVLQGLETTWNAKDLDANAEYVDSEMVSLPPGETPIRGEAANREYWENYLATMPDEWHPSPEEIWVSGDLAVAWGHSTSFGGPEGGEATESRGKNVWVFRRGDDGVWRMRLEMWSPDEAN